MKETFLDKSDALCFYKAMRSQVESFLRDHLVIGKQVLGRKWNATIDQIHCQKRRLLILLQYFFSLKLPTYKKHILIIHLPILNKSVLYWITKHGGTLNKVCWKWCRRISKYPNFQPRQDLLCQPSSAQTFNICLKSLLSVHCL